MLGILFSGGKDSAYTLYHFQRQGEEVACLLCLLPASPDMFEGARRVLVQAQADALGLPVLFREAAGERELQDLESLLREARQRFRIEGVGLGALAGEDQHLRVARVCEGLGLAVHVPLRRQDRLGLMREMVAAGFDIRMTRIAATGLDESWLGRRLTLEDVDRLAGIEAGFGVRQGEEGCEFDTVVLDGPPFAYSLSIEYEKRMETEERGELVITEVGL